MKLLPRMERMKVYLVSFLVSTKNRHRLNDYETN